MDFLPDFFSSIDGELLFALCDAAALPLRVNSVFLVPVLAMLYVLENTEIDNVYYIREK